MDSDFPIEEVCLRDIFRWPGNGDPAFDNVRDIYIAPDGRIFLAANHQQERVVCLDELLQPHLLPGNFFWQVDNPSTIDGYQGGLLVGDADKDKLMEYPFDGSREWFANKDRHLRITIPHLSRVRVSEKKVYALTGVGDSIHQEFYLFFPEGTESSPLPRTLDIAFAGKDRYALRWNDDGWYIECVDDLKAIPVPLERAFGFDAHPSGGFAVSGYAKNSTGFLVVPPDGTKQTWVPTSFSRIEAMRVDPNGRIVAVGYKGKKSYLARLSIPQ
ncbi:hypothetical protein HYV84_06040 [Candidatus Woesearchaeota archaeon]|nr:hypothetical protein [Candidatus Woesearchaeota archaeon]